MILADTLTTAALTLTGLAVLGAFAALIVAFLVMRQNAGTVADLRRTTRRLDDLTNDVDTALDQAAQLTEWATAADTQIHDLTNAINHADTPAPDGPPPTTAMPAQNRPRP
ncbi:MAG: hypothetical protein ACJ768_25550 [Gaiellaceae bacterium]